MSSVCPSESTRVGNVQKAFGRAVRRLRLNAGFSQEKFAHAVRVHRTFMGEIERGETNVSLEVIARIGKSLRLSLAELFSEVESG